MASQSGPQDPRLNDYRFRFDVWNLSVAADICRRSAVVALLEGPHRLRGLTGVRAGRAMTALGLRVYPPPTDSYVLPAGTQPPPAEAT